MVGTYFGSGAEGVYVSRQDTVTKCDSEHLVRLRFQAIGVIVDDTQTKKKHTHNTMHLTFSPRYSHTNTHTHTPDQTKSNQ